MDELQIAKLQADLARAERQNRVYRALLAKRKQKTQALSATLKDQTEQLSQRVSELVATGQSLNAARGRAEQADQAKSRFLAMMSHDIRTPMNAILATLDLLDLGQLEEGQAGLVKLALASGNQMLFLLADIIEAARADGWALELEQEEVAIRKLFESTTQSWQQLARHKGLSIQLEIENDVPASIVSDGKRVRQVLDNLVSNAVKFTHLGSIRVSASIGGDNVNQTIRIVITDTGAGIPAHQQRAIFQDLRRITDPAQYNVEGTGLGLSICARIAKAMGGQIGVESVEGQGSSFWFELPLIEPALERRRRPECARTDLAPLNTSAGTKPHILVAEDIETNRIIVAAVLDRLECSYKMVENGRAALNAIAREGFDAVLMDVSMPEMDGIEATRDVRARGIGAQKLPIIGLTGFASKEEHIAMRAAGMNGIVVKPIRVALLHEALSDALCGLDRTALSVQQERLLQS